MRRLAADIETLSVHDLGDATEQAVQVQVAAVEGLEGAPIVARPDPVLGWYLRNMRRLTWVAGPQVVEEAPPPLVVMVNGESFTGGDKGGYIGSEYDLEVYWNPDAFADAGPAEGDAASGAERLWPVVRTWWRWWMYGETSQRPDTRIVTLWAPVYAATAQ